MKRRARFAQAFATCKIRWLFVLFHFVLTEMGKIGEDFVEGLEIKWLFFYVMFELFFRHLHRY